MEGDNNDGYPGPNGNKLHVNDLMKTVLKLSASDTDPEQLNDIDTITGEYSALNNTMDELNKFLDVWEARHDHLRSEIKDALEESTAGNENSSEGAAANISTADQPTEESSSDQEAVRLSADCQPEKSTGDS